MTKTGSQLWFPSVYVNQIKLGGNLDNIQLSVRKLVYYANFRTLLFRRNAYVCAKWRAGEITATAAMKEVGLKPNTFYRRVKEMSL